MNNFQLEDTTKWCHWRKQEREKNPRIEWKWKQHTKNASTKTALRGKFIVLSVYTQMSEV